jgi:hypothetical protein
LIRTCVHEAGHAVVATALNGQIYGAFADDSGGRCEYEREVADDCLTAAVTYGGPYSECRWEAGQQPDSRQIAMALQRNTSDRRILGMAEPHAYTIARAVAAPLLERCWPAVMTLSAMLFRSGEIDNDDVRRVLGSELDLARLRRAVPGWVRLEHRIALGRVHHVHVGGC